MSTFYRRPLYKDHKIMSLRLKMTEISCYRDHFYVKTTFQQRLLLPIFKSSSMRPCFLIVSAWRKLYFCYRWSDVKQGPNILSSRGYTWDIHILHMLYIVCSQSLCVTQDLVTMMRCQVMRTGIPNYRLSRCGLCQEVVLYRYPVTRLCKYSMPQPSLEPNYCVVFAQKWSLYKGNFKRWLLYPQPSSCYVVFVQRRSLEGDH